MKFFLYLGREPNLVQHKKSTWTWTSTVSLPAEPQKPHLPSLGVCTWGVTEWSFHAALITPQGASFGRDLRYFIGFWNGYSIARVVDGCSKYLQVKLFPLDIDYAMEDDFIGLYKHSRMFRQDQVTRIPWACHNCNKGSNEAVFHQYISPVTAAWHKNQTKPKCEYSHTLYPLPYGMGYGVFKFVEYAFHPRWEEVIMEIKLHHSGREIIKFFGHHASVIRR